MRFAGYVPRESIALHFAAAHVFALPSYNEGMAIAALEAMGAGPVILAHRRHRRAGGGRRERPDVSWADVPALAGHIRRLAADRALARQMGAASRTRALEFDWNAIADRYLELFEQVSGKAPVFATR